ncbi:hypothetical protein TRFO_11729 [Tritrichomonas foetus]|uniref:PCI domain-containing protein n=1 Tax=Tritrichomonas foetus TaxID=1144522 RepID=A0A1J4J2B7_9EUKA|nr:hypothetical protein TRFO_11729 [Tritrichomonas foetus]|eukprot:OHS93522.1 hypothetical protein TRFO_11729 [Tritrichomonas foetus]
MINDDDQSKNAEQTLVENLLDDVQYPVSWRYMIHIIVNAETSSVRKSLHEKIIKRINYVDNKGYYNFGDSIISHDYSGLPYFRDLIMEYSLERHSALREALIKCKTQSEVNFSANAKAQAENLLFWNAIQNLKRDTRMNNKSNHFKSRAMLHISLDEWTKAKHLAIKSGDIEFISVISFSFGEFQYASQHFNELLTILVSNEIKTTIVSKFEICYILTLSLLASASLPLFNQPKMSEFIEYLQTKNLRHLSNSLINFKYQNFGAVIEFLQEIDKIGTLSIYICFAYDFVINGIKKNIIIHLIDQQIEISLAEIVENLGCEQEEVENLIQQCIEEGFVSGKINYRTNSFQSNPNVNIQQKEIEELNHCLTSIMKEKEMTWLENATISQINYREQSVDDLFIQTMHS